MIAFGHPDNVLSLCKNISDQIDLTLILVVAGNRFKQGILNINTSSLKYGLNTSAESLRVLPENISEYINNRFGFRILKTYDRKLLKDKFGRNFRIILKSSRVIKKNGYDVVHFNGSAGFLFYFMILLNKIPKVWTLHDFKPHTGEEDFKSHRFHKFLSKKNIKIIQHYKFLKRELIKEYNLSASKVFQVYSGYFDVYKSFHLEKPNNFSETKYILFFGRISKYKGIDLLIEQFSSIKNKYGHKLVIAGGGKLWFNVSDIDDDIIFINRYLETPELAYLISNCKFVVVPYTDATHSATVMTSYAFNKPVLISDVGGLSEVVINGKTGVLFSQPKDLGKEMEQLLSSEDQLSVMSKNITQFCKNSHISWGKIKINLISIYKQLD